MIWLALAAMAVAFAAGYAARHYRPLARVDIWAWDQDDRRRRDLQDGHTRRRPGWYGAQVVFAGELAVSFATQPRATVASVRETLAQRRRRTGDPS